MNPVFTRVLTAAAILATGCAHYPENKAIEKTNPAVGYRFKNLSKDNNTDSLQIFMAFSGGGTRAAALSYGVLEELARTEVTWEGQSKRLVDEVDYISAVSGGSFTAAYFALHRDKIFADFEKDFLNRNIQSALMWRLLSPQNWFRLSSPNFNRSDMAAEYYDQKLFRGATFGDLLRNNRKPFLSLNATDMSLGATFQFTQEHFDLLCSDISSFPLSRAVAASSAFPILLSPITINNYAGSCECIRPEWMNAALTNQLERSRRSIRAKELLSYQNSSEHPYLHLLDGGLSDNLGLRGPYEDIIAKGGVWKKINDDLDATSVKKMVMIVVNSATKKDKGWDRRKQPPRAIQVTVALGAVPMHRYSFETLELLKQSVAQWEIEWIGGNLRSEKLDHVISSGSRLRFYVIEISLEFLPEGGERAYLVDLPTSFNLPSDATRRLRNAAAALLRQSTDFQNLLQDIRSEQ